MPNVHFAKNIANIFNNYNSSDATKFDQCCKLVCELLEAHTVSMFLYDAQEDELTCEGTYLEPELFQYDLKANEKQEVFHNFLKDMPIHTYLSEGRKRIYSEYISHTGKSYSKLEEDKFNKAVSLWEESIKTDKIRRLVSREPKQAVRNYHAIFEEFIRLIHSERYVITDDENKTITGNYFFNLLTNTSIEQDIIRKPQSTWKEKGRYYDGILKKLGIQFSPSDIQKVFYVGSSLYANDRYSGVLRIVVRESKTYSIDFDERVSNISQIISLHLKSNFFLRVYRTLASMTLYKNSTGEIEDESLNDICETIVHILNCRGAIVRLGDANDYISLRGKKGNSKSLQPYVDYVKLLQEKKTNETTVEKDKKGPEERFSEDIYNIFSEEMNGNSIKAIQFSISNDNINKFNIQEYYFDGNKLKQRNRLRQIRDFDVDAIRTFRRLKIHEFIIVKLDDLDGGVIWFSNTANRKFIRSDIEIVLTIAKRISLEITPSQHHHRKSVDMEKQKNQAVDNAAGEWMNILLHQVGQVITSSANVINKMNIINSNLFKKRNFNDINLEIEKPHEFVQSLRLLGFLVNHARRQTNRSVIMRDIVNNSLSETNKNKQIPDLWQHVKNKCVEFDAYAEIEKEIHVWLSTPKQEIPFSLTTYEGLLDEAIFCLIDNAIKYSFHASTLKSKYAESVKFDANSFNTDGHISVSCITTINHVEISVTNWGSQIKEEEIEMIFEKNYRGSNKQNVVGTGIGLYLVKKIMNFLSGDVSVQLSPRNKTTFKLTLNR